MGRHGDRAKDQIRDLDLVATMVGRRCPFGCAFSASRLRGRDTCALVAGGQECKPQVLNADRVPFVLSATERVTLGVTSRPPNHSTEHMNRSSLKVAIIGAGYFARLQIEAWSRIDQVELVAVCDLDADQAQAGAKICSGTRSYTDSAEMLEREQIDLVDIATPPDSHLQLVTLACAAVDFVICQKPLAPTLEDARQIVATAATAGATLVVHENVRFMPWHREIRKLLDQQRVGQLLGLNMRLRPGDGQGDQAYLDRQPYFQKMPRFLVHETAIHWIDTFRYLAGEPSGVFARLQRLNPAIAGEDAGLILFDMNDGCTAVFDGNRLVDHDSDNPRRTMGELLIEGSHATIRLDGYASLFIRDRGQSEQAWPYSWNDHSFGGDCVHALQTHVVECLLQGKAPENTAEQYLRNIEIEEAVYESADKGCWLSL